MSMIRALCRYPIKGLSPEFLESVPVYQGQGLPLDRQFALAQGGNDFDPNNPQHQSKINYLMLMKNAKLAALHSDYQPDTGTLDLSSGSKNTLSFNLKQADGQQALVAFFNHYLADEIRGTGTRLLQAKGHMFSDVKEKVLSFVNLESVRALAEVLGTDIDPIRFRANVYISDLPAWAEHDWQQLSINQVRLETLKPITRCAATNVNPQTCARDLHIPQALLEHFGVNQLGMYMRVCDDGMLNVGDQF